MGLQRVANHMNEVSIWILATAPTDTARYPIWIDTSTNPRTLKFWNGSAWETVNGYA